MIALDASALLAFLFREPGHERVADALATSCVSTVNLSEVLARFVRDGHDPSDLPTRLAGAGVRLVSFGLDHAAVAAELFPATRPLGLSLGDRACLALARSRGIPAMTTDRAWRRLDIGVEIIVVR
jgi:ribonuclease VapC